MKKHLPLFMATLLDSPHGTDVPEIDLSPYPSGTYLVKINFERGVSVVRKAIKNAELRMMNDEA